jgi:Methane oxygenase PmoA
VRLQVRLYQRHHDDELIDVGDQDMFAAAASASQNAMPRFHALDETLGNLALLRTQGTPPLGFGWTKPNNISGGQDAATVGDKLLEQSPDGAAVQLAALALHDTCQSMHAKDPAAQTEVRIDRGHVRWLRRIPDGGFLSLDDGPPARQNALGADALSRDGRFLGVAVILEAAREVVLPRGLGPVFAQIDTDLFLLAHVIDSILKGDAVTESRRVNTEPRMIGTSCHCRPIIAAFLLSGPLCLMSLLAAEPKNMVVSLDGDNRYHFGFGGTEVTALYTDSKWAKPFLFPLIAPNGVTLTRAWPIEPKALVSMDHPHQKSAWFTHGEVSLEDAAGKTAKSIDFWAETPGHGRIVLTGHDVPPVFDKLTTTYAWQGPDGTRILAETASISLLKVAEGRLIVFEIDLGAAFGPVVFGDTKEGAFGVRVHDKLRVGDKGQMNPKGRITNADGKVGEKACWGYRSDWCDCSGEIDDKPAGIAIFDDPANKQRACWHVRDYGLMAANPFGRAKSGFPAMRGRTDVFRLGKSEHLKLRYGIYLHDGDASAGKVAEAFEWFVKQKD